MKLTQVFSLIGFLLCSLFSIPSLSTPSDNEILTALNKEMLIGKTTIKDVERLFGRPVSIVENKNAIVYAFRQSAVVKGLKIDQTVSQQISITDVSKSSSSAAVNKGEMKSSKQLSHDQAQASTSSNKIQGNLQRKTDSVDKIINFVFRENKLLSYKISSSN